MLPAHADQLIFNGLDATTGGYLTQTTRTELIHVAQAAMGAVSGEQQSALRFRDSQKDSAAIDADQRDLTQTGWGVLFPRNGDPRIRTALAPLLDLRRAQAGPRYRELSGNDGYRAGESARDFNHRHDAPVTGPVDAERLPYYLLIVASPEEIPFDFQYALDVRYAVGRLHFATLEAYTHYAQSVVQAEQELPALPRRITLFGVHNRDDRATEASATKLIAPLADTHLPNLIAAEVQRATAAQARADGRGRKDEAHAAAAQIAAAQEWQITALLAEQTYKAQLSEVLGGNATPALLFTASHGLGFPNSHPRQLSDQGGLVCQDWDGPASRLPNGADAMPREWYFSAADLPADRDVNLLGSMAFFFACYGGGTPLYDEFARARHVQELAPQPFLAQLPQAMLSHPAGGALAVVAHVERAWGYSFMYERTPQLNTFEVALKKLMLEGYPIGYCLDWFNLRYAETATDLTRALEQRFKFEDTSATREEEIARLWTTHNDARSYVVLGDPAVRLKVAGSGTQPRPRYTRAAYTIPETGTPTAAQSAPVPVPLAPQPTPPPVAPVSPTAPSAVPPVAPITAAAMDAARRATQMLDMMLADERFTNAQPRIGAIAPVPQPDGSTAVSTTLCDANGYTLEITLVVRQG